MVSEGGLEQDLTGWIVVVHLYCVQKVCNCWFLLYYMQLNFQSVNLCLHRLYCYIYAFVFLSTMYEAEQVVINIVTQLCCIQYSVL